MPREDGEALNQQTRVCLIGRTGPEMCERAGSWGVAPTNMKCFAGCLCLRRLVNDRELVGSISTYIVNSS